MRPINREVRLRLTSNDLELLQETLLNLEGRDKGATDDFQVEAESLTGSPLILKIEKVCDECLGDGWVPEGYDDSRPCPEGCKEPKAR